MLCIIEKELRDIEKENIEKDKHKKKREREEEKQVAPFYVTG